MPDTELAAWLETARQQIDSYLDRLFEDCWPASFRAPLRYPIFSGGKRIRPALVLAAWEGLTDGADPRPVLPAAAAVELIHTYSLVHDDLPAMDDDDERRGRPTVHVAYSPSTAILVGDALQTEAFSQLAAGPLSADVRVRMVAVLARASGSTGMVGGQVADIAADPSTPLRDIERLHGMKTGALITAAVELGGLAAGAHPRTLERLRRYGRNIGLAFQLADDILDADEDQGDDGPPSFVKLLGIDETRSRALALVDDAVDLVSDLPRPAPLEALARFTVQRSH